ncbi:MAG: hypothetical protein V3S14_01830, partial [Anaerolineae bacterium]
VQWALEQTRSSFTLYGNDTVLDRARERVRQILDAHQPRDVDPAVAKELQVFGDDAHSQHRGLRGLRGRVTAGF